MILYCVRHGESEFNADGRIQGQLDTKLSALGHEQGRAAALALARLPIQAVYSSPLARAYDTARYAAEELNLEIRTDSRLMEIHAGVFQGRLWHELEQAYPEAAAAWKSLDPDFRIPDGETRRELMQRGREAIEAIRDAGHEHVAVIAHGGLLTAALKEVLRIPPLLDPFRLLNCSINQLGWDNQFRLLSLNEAEHLREVNRGHVVGSGDL